MHKRQGNVKTYIKKVECRIKEWIQVTLTSSYCEYGNKIVFPIKRGQFLDFSVIIYAFKKKYTAAWTGWLGVHVKFIISILFLHYSILMHGEIILCSPYKCLCSLSLYLSQHCTNAGLPFPYKISCSTFIKIFQRKICGIFDTMNKFRPRSCKATWRRNQSP